MDSTNDTAMIIGLGNPGVQYRYTRHNAGFMVAQALADKLGISLTRVKFRSQVGSGRLDGIPVIIAKPLTYMNESGSAVSSLLHYFKVPLNRLLVIHDDLDLPLGTLRLRPGGGSAGQRGMQSIADKLGTNAFPRLRFGIGRPPGRMDPADYVLEKFGASEQELLKMTLDQAAAAAVTFIREGLEKAMNLYNGEVG
ncbi:MAG: aminoacyl-tRNA hydrolase [Chloroflexi bacterium]|jgi:PTH1 family peptidyl-tRNA hydrolase|nr:aminoacyl-tRNA hydrolase [Anaerolineaceae bacterium]NLI44628.1 aminoacyl-tRNA hydrolase [Chloroflexota bacterium]HOE35083.1 aminoacyl-tRNA hydrolase [Anaerolineaceae bacterium]HOT25707.1 aminoacyl-tRNA hydrolase [Anaerolineaceae bacterium]HQH57887.1 aminoacyl-tRNA hydrolase [Anaerolineaceae bacterium]